MHALQRDKPSGLSSSFVADPATGAFDNNADSLQVNATLWQQTQDAAIELANRTVSKEERLHDLVGGDPSALADAAERDAWLSRFGGRAFRRPLTPDELERFELLYEEGAAAFPDESAVSAGVRMVVVGALQSPHFLYRVERAAPGSDQLDPLSFASKLSFSLWNGPPDDALQARALTAANADEVLEELPRMLADDRARDMVRDLHRQLLHVDTYTNIPREFVSYEDYESTLNAAMQAEVDRFVEEVVMGGGSVSDLMTSRSTLADRRIAEIYGLEGVEGEGLAAMQPVELDPGERSGLLTLSGFLAVHSSEKAENLIRRAAFIHGALLCTPVPPAPPNATALPLTDEPQTMRERIEDHTVSCGGACHSDLLNPVAFAFGQYDETGRYRGDPDIDDSEVYQFSFGETAYDGAVELAELLAVDDDLHRCYATRLLTYLEGRGLRSADADRLDALAESSLDGEPILSLITQVVSHPDFRRVRALPD